MARFLDNLKKDYCGRSLDDLRQKINQILGREAEEQTEITVKIARYQGLASIKIIKISFWVFKAGFCSTPS